MNLIPPCRDLSFSSLRLLPLNILQCWGAAMLGPESDSSSHLSPEFWKTLVHFNRTSPGIILSLNPKPPLKNVLSREVGLFTFLRDGVGRTLIGGTYLCKPDMFTPVCSCKLRELHFKKVYPSRSSTASAWFEYILRNFSRHWKWKPQSKNEFITWKKYSFLKFLEMLV